MPKTPAVPDAVGRGAAVSAKSTGKHILLQGAGWLLVVVGLAAMVLPGPGLLALFAGMAMLATQYEWADRRLAPVRGAAMRGAAASVQSWIRILLSLIGVCLLLGIGVYWGISAAAPSWWPVNNKWWLVGGLGDRRHSGRVRSHRPGDARVQTCTSVTATTRTVWPSIRWTKPATRQALRTRSEPAGTLSR